MKIITSYAVKIKHYNKIFSATIDLYRKAVDFFIGVILMEWNNISKLGNQKMMCNHVERLTIRTKKNPLPKYDFGRSFYKFPAYMRRAAISCALGKVSSYKSNFSNWERSRTGKRPSVPKAGYAFPVLYRKGSYIREDDYTASIKVYRNNTWDWLTVRLKKSDADYILKHCAKRGEKAPSLVKRGKEYFLQFPFEERVSLDDVSDIADTRILAVDLGINNAATCSVMHADGTILARRFLKLAREQDCLKHTLNRIKKAQQHGAGKMPRLWARAKGINQYIAELTARFIDETAVMYGCNVIVFEHLDLQKKKRGSKKQNLHMWKANRVQNIVAVKAHRNGIRISHVNAWNTSRFAYDGSGPVERDKDNYSMCTFSTGKRYHADLSASYNIGARYFIREILRSLPATARFKCGAEVPRILRRSTCTWNDLISLNAVLTA